MGLGRFLAAVAAGAVAVVAAPVVLPAAAAVGAAGAAACGQQSAHHMGKIRDGGRTHEPARHAAGPSRAGGRRAYRSVL